MINPCAAHDYDYGATRKEYLTKNIHEELANYGKAKESSFAFVRLLRIITEYRVKAPYL